MTNTWNLNDGTVTFLVQLMGSQQGALFPVRSLLISLLNVKIIVQTSLSVSRHKPERQSDRHLVSARDGHGQWWESSDGRRGTLNCWTVPSSAVWLPEKYAAMAFWNRISCWCITFTFAQQQAQQLHLFSTSRKLSQLLTPTCNCFTATVEVYVDNAGDDNDLQRNVESI